MAYKNYTRLSKQEELDLANILEEFHQGKRSFDEYSEAIEKLFNSNISNIKSQTKKFLFKNNYSHYEYEDALQDSILAFLKKLPEYNPNYNTVCYTRLFYNIEKALRFNSCKYSVIPLTERATYGIKAVSLASEEFERLPIEEREGKDKTSFILEKTGLNKNIYDAFVNVMQPVAYTTFTSKDGTEEEFVLPDNLNIEQKYSDKEIISKIFEDLTQEERDLISFEYGLDGSENLENQVDKFESLSEYKKNVRMVINKLKGISNERFCRK